MFWDPALRPSSYQGVTTVVAGNCGFTIAPTRPEHHEVIVQTLENVEDMDAASLTEGIVWEFQTYPEYLELVRSRGTLLNFACYVGHSSVRLYVMGDAAYERAATAEEIDRMCRIVVEAIGAGAAGFSTSFAYTHRGMNGLPVPSRFAERDEVEALFMAAGSTGKGVVLATAGDQCTYADMYELQPRIGRPFTYPMFALTDGRNQPQLDMQNEAVARGLQVWPQVTPRPLTMQFTMDSPFSLNVSPVVAALMDQDRDARIAAYSDPGWRIRAAADLAEQPMRPRWETCEVSESDRHPELEGRRVDAIARERGCDPFDVICRLAVEEDLGHPVPHLHRQRRAGQRRRPPGPRADGARAVRRRGPRRPAVRRAAPDGPARHVGARPAGPVRRARRAQAQRRAGRHLRVRPPGVPARGLLGRRLRLRPDHRVTRPDEAGAGLPGGRRTADLRGAHGPPPRAGQRGPDPGGRGGAPPRERRSRASDPSSSEAMPGRAADEAAARAHPMDRLVLDVRVPTGSCASRAATDCGTLVHPPVPVCPVCREPVLDPDRGLGPGHDRRVHGQPAPVAPRPPASLRHRRGGPGRGPVCPADHQYHGLWRSTTSGGGARGAGAVRGSSRTCGSPCSSRPGPPRSPSPTSPRSLPAPRAPLGDERFEHRAVLSGVGRSALGRRLLVDPLSLTVDACLAAVADAGLELSDIDGLSTYPGAAGMGMSEGGVTAVEEALRLHPTWTNGGMDLPGPGGALIAAMLAVSSGLCRHVLCFRTVWESTFATLGLRPPGGGRASGAQQWRSPFGALSAANWIAMNANQYLHRYGATRELLGHHRRQRPYQRRAQPGGHLPGADDHGRLPGGTSHHHPVRPLRLRRALRRLHRRRGVRRLRRPATCRARPSGSRPSAPRSSSGCPGTRAP